MLLAILSIVCLLLAEMPLLTGHRVEMLGAERNHARNSISALEACEENQESELNGSARDPMEWIVVFDCEGAKGLAKFKIDFDGVCIIEYLFLIRSRDNDSSVQPVLRELHIKVH